MIFLTDVAAKLQELLNSYDPTDYLFVVKSAGYHLDKIANQKESRNEIPVFLTMIGGEYNPVPNLHQVNFTYEVNIWFPVRFKEDFYNLNANLEQWFVGKKVTFGSELALCNISVAETGEIVGIQVEEFANWVAEQYEGSVHLFKKEEEINEPYMNMRFRLFCTTLGDGFIFGNDVKYQLECSFPEIQIAQMLVDYNNLYQITMDRYEEGDEIINDVHYYAWFGFRTSSIIIYTTKLNYKDINSDTKFYVYEGSSMQENQFYKYIKYTDLYFNNQNKTTLTENLIWDQSGTGASISPVSEQLIGVDKFVKNTSNITNFNKSIVVYIKNTEFWKSFLLLYNTQNINQIDSIKLIKIYNFNGTELIYDYNQLILSYNENVELGSPLSFTLTFGDGE